MGEIRWRQDGRTDVVEIVETTATFVRVRWLNCPGLFRRIPLDTFASEWTHVGRIDERWVVPGSRWIVTTARGTFRSSGSGTMVLSDADTHFKSRHSREAHSFVVRGVRGPLVDLPGAGDFFSGSPRLSAMLMWGVMLWPENAPPTQPGRYPGVEPEPEPAQPAARKAKRKRRPKAQKKAAPRPEVPNRWKRLMG